MKNLKLLLTVFIIILFANKSFSQNIVPGGSETIVIKGFINATMFAQDQSFGFGNGQTTEWALPPEYKNDRWFYGGDIRNSRITLSYNGPSVANDWKLSAVLEMDFFGGFNGTGAFSQQQLIPRFRLGYVDLIKNNFTLRIGQAWTPLLGNVPISLSHLAFPLGYGSAGMVGWRYPGIYFYYKFLNNASTQLSLDAGIFEGSWSGPGNNINFLTAGNAGSPQFELRLNLTNKFFNSTELSTYLVGHYDSKDLSGVDNDTSKSLEGIAGEFGARIKSGGFIIHANFYSGKNIGQQFGHITQIQSVKGDLSSFGLWVQSGYTFSNGIGIFGFFGIDDVNDDDAKTLFGNNARLQNILYNLMLRYTTGPFSLGLEFLQSKLTYGLNNDTVTGSQIAFSILYNF